MDSGLAAGAAPRNDDEGDLPVRHKPDRATATFAHEKRLRGKTDFANRLNRIGVFKGRTRK
jgi:hypothetical protein